MYFSSPPELSTVGLAKAFYVASIGGPIAGCRGRVNCTTRWNEMTGYNRRCMKRQ